MSKNYYLNTVTELSEASWIAIPGRFFTWKNREFKPAPLFRREFHAVADGKVYLTIAAGGYYEVYINGSAITGSVLNPTPTNYDKRLYHITYEISRFLQQGVNTAAVILGNSIYSCNAQGVWMQDTITWRDYPKFICQINDESGRALLYSDAAWSYYDDGPIRMDSIRNGEIYDARKEVSGWMLPGFDDSNWSKTGKIHSPGGELVPAGHPPCVIYKTLPMKRIFGQTYDSGQNLAGWARLQVKGRAGTEIILRYDEDIDESGRLISQLDFVDSGEPRTDHYILKGGGVETWSPRFSYYGFRYIELTVKGDAEIISLEACAIGTDLKKNGELTTSDPVLNQIQQMTLWSYRSNMMGFPTDCPSREKQGWTGDALVAVETGLYNFDAIGNYSDWLDSVVDTQRPSGQIAAKAPISSNGYNWGYGPAWDSALILIPQAIYQFTGNDEPIRRHYPAMQKYLDFAAGMMTGHIALGFGLGDWCNPDDCIKQVPGELVTTAYYYLDLIAMARFAELLDKRQDQAYYLNLASTVHKRFNEYFYHGEGCYANDELTALAVPVAFGLATHPQETAARLNRKVQEAGFKSYFGIIGAKYVPSVLAEYGYIDTALKILTQMEYPGYGYLITQGATTLWERWNGRDSRNHIMFGSVSAWMYRYLGGFTFSPDAPGRICLKPHFTVLLEEFTAEYCGIVSRWTRTGDHFSYQAILPDDVEITLILPDGTQKVLTTGKYVFTIMS